MNGHQLAYKEIPQDTRFFNENKHEVKNLFDHKCSVEDGNVDFYTIVCTHLGETKTVHLKNDRAERICTFFDSKSPRDLLHASDFLRDGKNVNNRRKLQVPPMVVEANFHENFFSAMDSDCGESDNEVFDDDLVKDREIVDSREASFNATPSISAALGPKKTLKLTTETLDRDNVLANQENDSVLLTVW